MFSLKSFLQAIQGAILTADDALKEKNLSVLQTYFEKDADDAEIQKRIDKTLASTQDILDAESTVSRQSLEDVMESLKQLKTSLTQPDAIEQALAESDLRPKTVILNYPIMGKDGSITNKEVHVPLITLIPVTFSKIEEMTLKADLELTIVDDEVQVGLGKINKNNPDDTSKPANKNSIGSIEIVMKPQHMSDGMQHVVDAYEKVLKAQLPN